MKNRLKKLPLFAASLGLFQPLFAVDPVTLTPPGGMSQLESGAGHLWAINGCGIQQLPTESAEETPRFGVLRPENPCFSSSRIVGQYAPASVGVGYHLNSNGQLRRIHPSGATLLATSPNPANIRSESRLALSPDFAFWSEVGGEIPNTGSIHRASKFSPEIMETVFASSDSGTYVRQLHAVDDETLYVLFSNENLLRFSRSVIVILGRPVVSWSSLVVDRSVTAFQANHDRIYWSDHSSNNHSQFFRSASYSALGEITTHSFDANSSPRRVTSFVFDGRSFYYQSKNGGSGPIKRAPINPTIEIPFEITSVIPPIDGEMHAGTRFLYWRIGATIQRIPIGAAAVERDFRAVSMEVIQATQTTANDVDLIVGKPTTVRLLAALTGEVSSVVLSPGALLYGSDSAGDPLPGSPLFPGEFAPIFDRPHDRNNADEGFNFRLPDEWTRQGTVTLRGVVNPNRELNETSRVNNSLSVTREFLRKAPITLWFHPLSTRAGLLGGTYEPWMEPYFERAASLLPTSGIIPIFRGGRVLEEYQFPFSYDPYDLPSGFGSAGLEALKINFKLASRWRRSGDPAISNRLNSRVIHSAMVTPNVEGWGIGGQAFPHGHCMVTNMDSGRSSRAYDQPRGGQTMAHEISHSHGIGHNCLSGLDDFPVDGDYPYDCSFSDGNGVGYDALSGQFIFDNGDVVGDTMSYNARRWPSDYNWQRLSRGLDLVRGLKTMPAGEAFPRRAKSKGQKKVTREKGADDESCYLITGFYDPETGENLLAGVIPVAGETLEQAEEDIASALAVRTGYSLIGTDEGGATLFKVAPSRMGVPEVETGFYYLALIDSVENLARIELRTTSSPAVLSAINGGGSPPVTKAVATLGGALLRQTLEVSWTASDPNDDDLLHTVRYLPKKGGAWQTLIADTPLDSVSVSLAELPGSEATGLIEVITSDGILTTTDQVSAPAIPKKAPQVYLFTETESSRSCDLVSDVFLSVGDFLGLRTRCLDREDGTLSDSSIAWSLSGPIDRSATGSQWELNDLPTGDYTVTVTATDSDGMKGTAEINITVDLRYVSDAPSPVVFDGYPDEAAWLADRHPTLIRYGSSVEGAAVVRMIIEDEKLLVSVSGLSNGSNAGEFVGVAVDQINGDPNTPRRGDYRFDVFSDGRTVINRGDAIDRFIPAPELEGFEARVSRNGEFWSAELAIDLPLISGITVPLVGISVGHYHRDFSGDDHLWPASAVWNRPSTWPSVQLNENPDDPYDGDDDNLPDAWERENLGTTSTDGSGDRDQDGMSDASEYLAGTSPNDPTDLLKVKSFSLDSNDRPTLTFDSVAGRSYSIETSSDLESWAPIEVGLAASPLTRVWTAPASSQIRQFLRIKAHYCR